MRRWFFLLLFWCLPVFGSAHTAIWCPVNPGPGFKTGAAYQVCIGNTATDCLILYDWSWVTSYQFTIPDTANAWLRVRAVALDNSNNMIVSAYSNPVQIISGLTPPAIGGCP